VGKRNSKWLVVLAMAALGCTGGSSGDATGGTRGADGSASVTTVTSSGVGTTGAVVTSADPVGGMATGGRPATGGRGGTGGSDAFGGTGGTGGDAGSGTGGAPGETTGGAGEGGAPPDVPVSACAGYDPDSLEVSSVDANCDGNTPDECEEGTHIDIGETESCAICALDTATNRSCSWAEACFEPFLQTIAHRSGAMACEEDSDCSGVTIRACGAEVSLALRGLLDEELPIVAELYAEQNCGSCGEGSSFSHGGAGMPTVCVSGGCAFAE